MATGDHLIHARERKWLLDDCVYEPVGSANAHSIPRFQKPEFLILPLEKPLSGPDVPSTRRVATPVTTTTASSDLEPPFPKRRTQAPRTRFMVHRSLIGWLKGRTSYCELRTLAGRQLRTSVRRLPTAGRRCYVKLHIDAGSSQSVFRDQERRRTKTLIVQCGRSAAAMYAIPDARVRDRPRNSNATSKRRRKG